MGDSSEDTKSTLGDEVHKIATKKKAENNKNRSNLPTLEGNVSPGIYTHDEENGMRLIRRTIILRNFLSSTVIITIPICLQSVARRV